MDAANRFINTRNLEAFVEKEYDRDISPIGTIQANTPIEFQIPGTSNFYVSLANSYFDIQCHVVLPDGGNIPNDATVGPVNLLSHSLFSNIELCLNGKQISEPTNHYQYRAYLETITNYSSTVLEKRHVIEGWTLDTAGQLAVTNGHQGANTGLLARHAWIAASRNVRFIFRPHLDLFHQDADIPPNTDIRIRLIPARDSFYLMAVANDIGYRLQIRNIRFWIRTREVSAACLIGHNQQLHSGLSFRITMPTVRMKTIAIPAGSQRCEYDNLYMGMLPHRILLAMVSDEHMNGTYMSNPFNFQHFTLNHIAIRVNGEQIPRVAYQPNFEQADSDYNREYLGTLSALDLDSDCERSLCINPQQWATGFTFFAFKLFPNQSQIHPSGSIRLEIRFANQTPNIVNIILLAESAGAIEIDKYKNILIS